MTKKIFRAIAAAALATLLLGMAVTTGLLYRHFSAVQEQQLRDELHMAAQGVQLAGEAYLQSLTAESYRLTWVDGDGRVLYDTEFDETLMPNHADRQEIAQAFAAGRGSSRRYSDTVLEQTIYEAVQLDDGTVLRISTASATVMRLVMGMLWPMTLVMIFAAAFALWLARRMAGSVVEPLEHIDLDHPLEAETYDELSPFLRRIYRQHEQIGRQMESLRQKQQEFDQITAHMREGLVLLDGGGYILSINAAAKKLFGVEDHCLGADFLTVDRKQEMRTAIAAARREGACRFTAEMAGREYEFDLSRIGGAEDALGLVILAFDNTERLHAERTRREFTANVSHELKTPLQSIMGSAELMERGLVKPEDTPVFLSRIRSETTRLVSLIDDIIRLSQLDEHAVFPREEVSLHALADEVADMLAPAAEQKQVAFTVSGGEGVLLGVKGLLFEVVYNLCDNAIKYNVPGGRVEVGIGEDEKEVCLTVADTGIGIAPEHRDKIFERFYRVDKSHSKLSGGTGLGLSIVKHAVAYHGGTISLDSAAHTGTRIRIVFPKTGE